MNTFIKIVAIIWLGITISLIINTEAKAQKKSDDPTITQVNTDEPYFEFILGGDSRDNTGLRILVVDRARQYVAMDMARTRAQAKQADPVNYWVKLINVPEINPLAFKQAETMEENQLPEDGITVLVVRFKDLEEAALTWYQK